MATIFLSVHDPVTLYMCIDRLLNQGDGGSKPQDSVNERVECPSSVRGQPPRGRVPLTTLKTAFLLILLLLLLPPACF